MQFWDVLKNLKIVIGKKKKEEVCFLEKRKTDFLLGSTSQICRGYISSTTLLSEFPFPTALSLSLSLSLSLYAIIIIILIFSLKTFTPKPEWFCGAGFKLS